MQHAVELMHGLPTDIISDQVFASHFFDELQQLLETRHCLPRANCGSASRVLQEHLRQVIS